VTSPCPNGLPPIVDPDDLEGREAGDIDGSEGAAVQEEAVEEAVFRGADDLPAVIDPGGYGLSGAGDIDGGKGVAVQEEAVSYFTRTTEIDPNDLPALIDPGGYGEPGGGAIKGGDGGREDWRCSWGQEANDKHPREKAVPISHG